MKAGVVLVLPPSVEEVDVVECCASDLYGDMAGLWPGDLRDVEVCIGLGGNREWGLREEIIGRERGRTLMNSLITMAFIVLGIKLTCSLFQSNCQELFQAQATGHSAEIIYS